jgi:hypothetical protein
MFDSVELRFDWHKAEESRINLYRHVLYRTLFYDSISITSLYSVDDKAVND